MFSPKKLRDPFLIFIGDVIVLYASLWLTLTVRYLTWDISEIWVQHFVPFSLLFVVWGLVFFIAGLYERRFLILPREILKLLLRVHVIDSVFALAFFYFIPYFGIAPKINLFIFLAVSFVVLLLWRLFLVPRYFFKKDYPVLFLGGSQEGSELVRSLHERPVYHMRVAAHLKGADITSRAVRSICKKNMISIVVADFEDGNVKQILPELYRLLLDGVDVVDMRVLYEEVQERVPLSLINYEWILKNVSTNTHFFYDVLKRALDIILAFIFGIVSLLFYPFVYAAVKFDDGGPLFVKQERVGRGNQIVFIWKFRTMKVNDKGKWVVNGDRRITRVGRFLRKTRIDELPQLWNILKGDLSFIGPRPDIIGHWEKLRKSIPFYEIRNIITPGLSGWAQIKQELPPQSLEETRIRLMYDLYYMKNRSFFLDIVIIIKTIRTLLSRTGV